MKIEIVQLAGRDGDTAYNLNRALKAIAACAPDTDIVLFPEAYITGFLDAGNISSLAEPLTGSSVQAIEKAAREHNIAVVIGLIENDNGNFYNTTLFITPQGISLRYRKTHLWISEPGLVLPGDRYATVEWRGVRIGFLICYDMEFAETARALTTLGAELLLATNGNMEPYGYVHRTALTARAQENQVFAVMANRVGEGSDDLIFAGGSAAIDPFGRMLFEAGREECRHAVELNFAAIAASRAVYDYHADQRQPFPGEATEYPDGRRELLIP